MQESQYRDLLDGTVKMLSMDSQDKDTRRFLDDEEASTLDGHGEHSTRQRPGVSRRLVVSLVFNILAGISFLYLYTFANPHPQAPFPQLVYSPAQDALEYKTVVFNSNSKNDTTIYQGLPSEEVDSAWEDLYRDIGLSVIDRGTALKLPNMTVAEPHGSEDYIVSLDIFHQLHCLNQIRKALHPEYYGGHPMVVYAHSGEILNATKTQDDWHLAHCVDSIRQSLMCSVDISTLFWEWLPDQQRNTPDSRTTHTCRDFEKVREWAVERQKIE